MLNGKKLKVHILAGTNREAKEHAQEHLNEEYIYICSIDDALQKAQSYAKLRVVGTFWDLKDSSKILSIVMSRKNL
jgi:hypothetical protein